MKPAGPFDWIPNPEDAFDWMQDTYDAVRGKKSKGKASSDATKKAIQIADAVGEFSGINQGIRGSSPNASNIDKALALASMISFLGGQEAGVVGKAINKALSPKYTYGLHISPTGGLKELKTTPTLSRWMDDMDGGNYFFETKNLNPRAIREMERYLSLYSKQKGKQSVSLYMTRTPQKGVRLDQNINPPEMFNSKKPPMPKNFKKALGIWQGGEGKDFASKLSPFDFAPMDRNARYTLNPLEVLKEFEIGRNYPKVDGIPDVLTGEYGWKRDDFIKALTEINKKQPRASRQNKKWIKATAEQYKKWWDNLSSDIKDEMQAMIDEANNP